MVLRKDQLEAQLHVEKKEISDGKLKDDNPLDLSQSFATFCEACRRGDLKVCQEMITKGANINARDRFDYTPLILVKQSLSFLDSPSLRFLTLRVKSFPLCGHYEVVQLLLESGALCERDTFQGERCLYNALNDRIRNLLLQYDYSKSTDPLQPLASHITSLLTREEPKTTDITLTTPSRAFHLHKFVLSARSPYFQRKLAAAPETVTWRLSNSIPVEAFDIALRYLYLGEIPVDIGAIGGPGSDEQEILEGIDKLSRLLEIRRLFEGVLESGDRRLTRQRRTDEVTRGRDQFNLFFRDNVLRHKIQINTTKAHDVKWDRNNGIFADVLLCADVDLDHDDEHTDAPETSIRTAPAPQNGIPVGPVNTSSQPASQDRRLRQSTLFPVHRAMLLRSEFFLTMFSSSFREAQHTEYLQVIPIDCSPEVLEIVLNFLYTENVDVPLELALEVLFAADLLLIERLKVKAAVVISTLGNGKMSTIPAESKGAPESEGEQEVVDIYDVIRAGWLTRVHRLEEFGARYLAYRLESYIEEDEFADLIRESAARITKRQETDSIELLDDIRYYLSERFRLRFDDAGLEELLDEEGKLPIESEAGGAVPVKQANDEAIDVATPSFIEHDRDASKVETENYAVGGAVRTLDGEIAGDEFSSDAVNYQILLGKIDSLLERLKLDA
ncbi:MAG: hypothetical protein M1835_003711 [Candelina submexicana]|nr:MAG: hypothetical protein M1835_003711 [Candelina submexicana]